MLSPPPLFKNKKEFFLVSLILIAITAIRLFFYYLDYKELKNLDGFYYSEAQIIKEYETKNNSILLKLKDTDGLNFYLFTDVPFDRFSWVRVKIKLKDDTTFWDYLKGFFAKGEVLEQIEPGFDAKALLREAIDKQHKNYQDIKTFYHAIFLADPLDKKLRQKISSLGVSHLVALSGFHLGIIWLIVFGFFYIPYRYFQQKYYPWRHRNIDLGLLTLLFLAIFVVFVGAPASLVRSYVMLALGWFVLTLGLELISFEFLAFAVLLILAIAPKLIASLGFLLSVTGVFYIFLVIKWLRDYPSWFITLIAIPVGIFLLMFPIGHFFFPDTSIWQLCSPILSVIFIIFYPIVAILHMFGLGWLFDKELLWLFSLPKNSVDIYMPTPLILGYVALSILAIFSKRAFYLLLIVATLITGWYMLLANI